MVSFFTKEESMSLEEIEKLKQLLENQIENRKGEKL